MSDRDRHAAASNRPMFLASCLLAGLLCLSSESLLVGTSQAPKAALYTGEQAEVGRKLYAARCAACHGANLRGATAPALAGPAFTDSWGIPDFVGPWSPSGLTADDLLFVMRTTMPPGAWLSFSSEDHAAVLAYILQQNAYPAGNTRLQPDSPLLKEVRFRRAEGEATAEPAPAFIKGRGESVPASAGPSQEELNAASRSTRDWLYHTHDYSGARFVALDQINSTNAGQLRTVCAYQLGELGNFQTGPIAYQGTMYVTTVRTTVALDASTCRPKWRHTWESKDREVWLNNRGVAIKGGRVVRGTADGYLLTLNAQTGELIWARKVADSRLGEALTMAPFVYEDLIVIGPAGSENAISGWVAAFRLSDGSEVWKFKTVPGAEEGGSKSWQNPAGIKIGGGAVWTPFSFDPDKGEIYVAVTNPAPDLPANLRPGDNLYTNSLVALDVRTGTLRWYKQLVPSDDHDWDLTHVSPLFRTVINGRERNLVATVGKDGVLRTLDRETHETLYQTPVTTRKNADAPVTSKGVLACPGFLGGVEWNGPAFNARTNQLYVGAVDWCATFWAAEAVRHIPGRVYFGGTVQLAETSQGWLTAVDAATGEVRWRYRSPRPIVAAVTTTSGNVVFSGELTGDFLVLDARSGEVLYRFNTGGPIGGGIITYELNGKQYVAVMSGRPSPLWVDQNPGAPTVFVLALP